MDHPTVMVTSTSGPYITGAAARKFERTIWAEPNFKTPLWVYHENSWDKKHEREPLTASMLPKVDCFVDVFEANPGLSEIISKKTSTITKVYDIEGTRSLSEDIYDGKALIRKLSSLYHAASQLADGTTLIWVDVDTNVNAEFDDMWRKFVSSRDITYIPELTCTHELDDKFSIDELPQYCQDFRIESGIMALTVSDRIREFLAECLRWYDGKMLTLATKCLAKVDKLKPEECQIPWIRNNLGMNDIYVLAMVLHKMKPLKHGWFANEPFSCGSNSELEKQGLTRYMGHCQPCMNKKLSNGLVAPFWVFKYITHHKGGVGMIAMQHDPNRVLDEGRDSKLKSKIKTSDPEMKLPPNYFRTINTDATDTRPACGDPGLRSNCFHHIACKDAGSTLTTPGCEKGQCN